MAKNSPALIIVGGPAGSGKTSIGHRLSIDLSIPRLDSDTFGKTIRRSPSHSGNTRDAYVIGYTLLWRLCEEFLLSGISVIVDTNMGWEESWRSAEVVHNCRPDLVFLPIVLSSPRDVCITRIRQRNAEQPDQYGPPEWFMQGDALQICEFLESFDRADVRVIDAARPLEDVYLDVKQHVVAEFSNYEGKR
jgi:predicted kinase